MPDSLTLTTIILGELVFVLALTSALLGTLLLRESRQQKKILAAYHKLRETLRQERARRRQQTAPAETTEDPQPSLIHHLEQMKTQAGERYHSITQANLPKLSPDQPFSAKIAALRYLYCEAEEEALKKNGTSGDPWGQLEKQLYDVVRWVVDRQPSREGKQRNNQVKLLQQRVEKLKGYEKLSRDLQRRLALSQNKREALEQLQQENQATIQKLKHINHILSLSQESGAGELREQLHAVLQPAPPTGNERRMTNIEQFAADNQRLHADLIKGFREYGAEYPPAPGQGDPGQREKLERTIRRLEAELYRSQQHVKALRGPSEADAELTSEQGRSQAMSHIEETLKVLHTDMAASAKTLSGDQAQLPGTPGYSMKEIQQLRLNNTRQRNLIVDLESELTHLRDALPKGPEADEGQKRELERLERLVKECEHCILALESEVDMLHNQLQEQEDSPAPQTEDSSQQALDALAQRLEDALQRAERDATLSEFVQASLQAHSLEELAMALIEALKRARLTAGFTLYSPLGRADYFPSQHFSEREHHLVRDTVITDKEAYLNEGILFAHHHIHLLLKDAPPDPTEFTRAEELVHALLNGTSARVEALTLAQSQHHQGQMLDDWSRETHNTLVNMEIRYAYQAEEAQRLVNVLIEQMRRVASALRVNEATQTVIDNALNECQAQIRHLFIEDATLENGFDQLLSQVEELPKTLRETD